ncbi:MAG: aldo/keto reductase [Candidatus Thioglobus sp.]|jgi:aryl-alcohol dehydrogenase-like predicted oxidoreductase
MLNESKIALGTVQFGVDYGISSIDGQVQPKEVESILNYAYAKGINLLDTAPAYGDSEQVLGKINVNNFKIITKTRHFDNSEITSNDLELLNQDFSKSLVNLKQDSVYGVLVHNADDLLKSGSEKILDQLQVLKQEKKIEKIGVSIYDYYQLQAILENFDIDLVQLPFNILDRRLIDNGMLSILKNKGIEVHARSIFLQGLLLMSEKNRPDKFKRWSILWKIWREWLNDNKITALEATTRYAVSISEISKVLVGVDTVDQLKEIVVASSGVLPDIPPEMFTNDVDLLNPSNWGKL